MRVYKELELIGFFDWYCKQYGSLNYYRYESVYDSLPLDNVIIAHLNACAIKFFLQNHHLYAVLIPTTTISWTFKTMTVVEGVVEVPPYNHVESADFASFDEAQYEAIKKLIEIVKEQWRVITQRR